MSQEELAKILGVHSPVIGRYERNEVKPSIEVAVKIANALDVSLDYLVGNTDLKLDKDVMNRILELQKLKNEDKNHVFFLIDTVIRDFNARKAYAI